MRDILNISIDVNVYCIFWYNKECVVEWGLTVDSCYIQVINGESWPLHVKDANVPMMYPDTVPQEIRFALGHKDFGLLPGLFMYATIWMREHNRLCDILTELHPEWDDERYFQTAKLILLGRFMETKIYLNLKMVVKMFRLFYTFFFAQILKKKENELFLLFCFLTALIAHWYSACGQFYFHKTKLSIFFFLMSKCLCCFLHSES